MPTPREIHVLTSSIYLFIYFFLFVHVNCAKRSRDDRVGSYAMSITLEFAAYVVTNGSPYRSRGL